MTTQRIVCQIHGFSSEMIFIIFFTCIPLVHSELHTLNTTYTGKKGQTAGTPEFSSVSTLDGLQIDYYDSVIKKLIPKQDWMKEFASTDQWKEYTEIREQVQQIYKINITNTGDHTYQRVYGCVWDDETGDRRGFDEYSYDGESFISLDLKEIRYTASVPQAEPTVEKWNNNQEQLDFLKQYYRYKCIYLLKELLHYSKASFNKTSTVPMLAGQSLTEPTQKTEIDTKSDGSSSYASFIIPAVIFFLISGILFLLYKISCALRNNWNPLKHYWKNSKCDKEDESDEQNHIKEPLTLTSEDKDYQ